MESAHDCEVCPNKGNCPMEGIIRRLTELNGLEVLQKAQSTSEIKVPEGWNMPLTIYTPSDEVLAAMSLARIMASKEKFLKICLAFFTGHTEVKLIPEVTLGDCWLMNIAEINGLDFSKDHDHIMWQVAIEADSNNFIHLIWDLGVPVGIDGHA